MRYLVKRSHDSMGGMYATGPLTFLETDSLGKAEAEVIARGGVVIDTQESAALLPLGKWMPLDEFNDRAGASY